MSPLSEVALARTSNSESWPAPMPLPAQFATSQKSVCCLFRRNHRFSNLRRLAKSVCMRRCGLVRLIMIFSKAAFA